MQKISKSIVLAALVGLVLGSCTMEKRLYNKGYHVEWKRNYKGLKDVSKDAEEFNNTVALNEVIQQELVPTQESVSDTDIPAAETKTNTTTVVEQQNQVVVKHEIKLVQNNSSRLNVSTSFNPRQAFSKAHLYKRPVIKKANQSQSGAGQSPDKALLIVLCFLIPWLAVGLATNWEIKPLVFNLLWSLTCIGGIIHALIVVSREA